MELLWKNGTHQDCYDNKPGINGWCGVCDSNAKSGEEGFCNSATKDSLSLRVCSLTTVTNSRRWVLLAPLSPIFVILEVKPSSPNFWAFRWFCYTHWEELLQSVFHFQTDYQQTLQIQIQGSQGCQKIKTMQVIFIEKHQKLRKIIFNQLLAIFLPPKNVF